MLEPDPDMSERQLARKATRGRKFASPDEKLGFIDGYEAALLDVREWASKKLGEVPGG